MMCRIGLKIIRHPATVHRLKIKNKFLLGPNPNNKNNPTEPIFPVILIVFLFQWLRLVTIMLCHWYRNYGIVPQSIFILLTINRSEQIKSKMALQEPYTMEHLL